RPEFALQEAGTFFTRKENARKFGHFKCQMREKR
ncbi:unnamed protein product, partial [marine sediment metagenome]